ncbi:hypothetical protein ABID39_001609 [Bartonella japonica]|uniref:Uncharacterized protein n=1 Tax=Bartonella japonica TaxID=357761 RepID=A0ABV2FQT2_9HYPH
MDGLWFVGFLIAFLLIVLFQTIRALKKQGKEKEIVAYCTALFLPMFVPWIPLSIIFIVGSDSTLVEIVACILLAISMISLGVSVWIMTAMRDDGEEFDIISIVFMNCLIPIAGCVFIGAIILSLTTLYMWDTTIGTIVIGLLVLIVILIRIKEYLGIIFWLILIIALIKFIV